MVLIDFFELLVSGLDSILFGDCGLAVKIVIRNFFDLNFFLCGLFILDLFEIQTLVVPNCFLDSDFDGLLHVVFHFFCDILAQTVEHVF